MKHLTWLILASCLPFVACGSDDDSSGGGAGSGGTSANGGSGGNADASVDAPDDTSTQSETGADGSEDAEQDTSTDAQEDVVTQDGPSEAAADAIADGDQDSGADRPCTLGGDECEPGEKCAPVGVNDALVCRPDGDKQIGQECGTAGVDDCVSGAACVAYDATLSWCAPLCDANVACNESYQACFDWFGPGGTVAGACLGDDCVPPATQCESSERCTVITSGFDAVAACVPAGPVAVGGDCSVDECEPGAMCVQAGSELVCRAFCDGGADCGADDQHCVWPWPPLPDVGLCRAGCDPVRQTGCTGSNACYFEDPSQGSTVCFPAGALAEGEDCSSLVELCAPGLDCVLEPGSDPFEYYCRAFCDADHPCATGTCTTTDATAALRFCMP